MASSQHKPASLPMYPLGDDGVHNHFYQIQADDRRPVPWYRPRRCLYVAVVLAAVLLAALIAGIVAVVATLKAKSVDGDAQHASPVAGQSTATTTSTSSTSSSSPATLTEPGPSLTTVSSVVTVTFTKPEESKDVETTVITLTATQTEQEQDIGEMLSSMLSPFPVFTTKEVTVTAKESTSSATPSSETAETTSSTSTSSSATPSPSLSSPSLSNLSHLAVIDVNVGPPKLHRRLMVWQDEDANIVARDSVNGRSTVYHVHEKLADAGPRPRLGTHLAAAVDDSGAIHVFYIGNAEEDGGRDETYSVAHLVQQSAGEWELGGESVDAIRDSSLSATWHRTSNGTRAVLLGFQGADNEVCLLIANSGNTGGQASRDMINVTELLALDSSGWSAIGLSIASGVPFGRHTNRSGASEAAKLYVLMEGAQEALVAECSIEGNSNESSNTTRQCQWLKTVFTNADGDPIQIASHPTQLAWTLLRPTEGDTPIIDGFLTLGAEGSTIDDHRLVEGEDGSDGGVPSSTSSAAGARSTMVSYKVVEADIEAMAMTGGTTLLVRAGTRLFEFSFVEGRWQDRREIDTVLSPAAD